METILVTGGAGFIGSGYVLRQIDLSDVRVVNLDLLTYAGNPANLSVVEKYPRYVFIRGDIGDADLVRAVLNEYRPAAVLNFAAESHVDRSIAGPAAFMQTNVIGVFRLLEEVRRYWEQLPGEMSETFRFLHVSTDEVYGSLGPEEPPFHEATPYAPNSPYSASKAAGDHLVRAYHHTYGLPVLTTNCSNNYGPRQFPEKLIPLMILNGLEGKPLPVYGDGLNVRDWIFVDDHCAAVEMVLKNGRVGETYNIGGGCQKTNLEVVRAVCDILDEVRGDSPFVPHASQIKFVGDRPGHDRRYAVDSSKIERELGWGPMESFESGLRKTVRWYLDNPSWIDSVRSGEYRDWIRSHYGPE